MGTLGEDHGEATAITTVTIPEVNPELLPSDRPAAQVGEYQRPPAAPLAFRNQQPGIRPLKLGRHGGATFQVISGSYSVMRRAISVVFGPRFFSNTIPCWLTMKVITPELP